jgi:hypothetical protein
MGRSAESIPVLPTEAGLKQDVLMNAYSVRAPGETFGLHVSTGRGNQPADPVIS